MKIWKIDTMEIKATLREWKEAPKYSDIRKLILKDKSDEELIHIRNLCMENKKRLRYLGLLFWGVTTVTFLIISVAMCIYEHDAVYLGLWGLFAFGMCFLWVVDPSGPSTNTRKAIEEILIERYENWN